MATTKRRHRHRAVAERDESELLLLLTGERAGFENPVTPFVNDSRQL